MYSSSKYDTRTDFVTKKKTNKQFPNLWIHILLGKKKWNFLDPKNQIVSGFIMYFHIHTLNLYTSYLHIHQILLIYTNRVKI